MGADLDHARGQAATVPNQLTRISQMIDAGELRVFMGAAFPLQEASQAYAHKPVRGKNVIVVHR